MAALVLSACGGSDEGGGEQEPLVFAAVPSEESEQLEASFEPLLAALEEDLGVPIEFEAVTSNAGVIEAQVAERVDIAVYGAFSYHLASTRAEVEPIAAPIQGPGMEPGAVTYGVVRSDDSSIQSLEDAAGKDICFTDPGSTTGYLQPLAALLEAGVDPEADAQAVFTGGHDTSVASLLAGDCDLAFVGDVFIDRLLPARGLLDPAAVTKVWTSPTIPAPPLVVGTWLPEETRAQIEETVTSRTAAEMAEAGFCEGSEIDGPESWGDQAGVAACTIDASNAWAFVPASAEDYEPIARICEITEAEVCTEGE
ncbi:phosphate/phosphite/phosphonate ABC transporter substrate-binding protein [Blastococcus montanus]|uniref:phosphate/phosphite/phosphonate ABC transporter substrate-binding protein n=1 Tax=Blastococcus montanus TaxID=3144973 RepID=UPI003207FC08